MRYAGIKITVSSYQRTIRYADVRDMMEACAAGDSGEGPEDGPLIVRVPSRFRYGRRKPLAVLGPIVLLCFAATAAAADWPMYRADAARSGYTAEPLAAGLTLHWRIQEPHRPVPAWPTSNRMPFDRANRVVVAGGKLCYGTSADDKVVCRDAATGAALWTFIADARLAWRPCYARGPGLRCQRRRPALSASMRRTVNCAGSTAAGPAMTGCWATTA